MEDSILVGIGHLISLVFYMACNLWVWLFWGKPLPELHRWPKARAILLTIPFTGLLCFSPFIGVALFMEIKEKGFTFPRDVWLCVAYIGFYVLLAAGIILRRRANRRKRAANG